MAMNRLSKIVALGRIFSNRSVHTAAPLMITDKPLPDEHAFNVGFEKIRLEAKKVGEDPFENDNRDEPTELAGSGTKADPFIVHSRNTKRLVMVELGRDSGPPPSFWVTKDEGGRCPITGRHYKLVVTEGDKWGINELDLFMH